MEQRLHCVSFLQFEQLCKENGWIGHNNVPNDVAIISIIGSEDCRDENERHICFGENVLNLEFDDCDPTALGLEVNDLKYTYKQKIINANCETYEKNTTLYFFNNDMAKQAVEFIEKNINKNFYIHCFAGVSRSQAFVRFIETNYPNINWITNKLNPCQCPNYFVCYKLQKYYRENLQD